MHTGTGGAMGAVLAIVSAGGALWATSSTASQQFRQSYALAPSGRVVIDNPYGDVRISAWDRDEVRIEAVKSASDASRSLFASSDAGRGKSELRRAVCRITSGRAPVLVWAGSLDGKCHRKYTAWAFAGRGKGEKVR